LTPAPPSSGRSSWLRRANSRARSSRRRRPGDTVGRREPRRGNARVEPESPRHGGRRLALCVPVPVENRRGLESPDGCVDAEPPLPDELRDRRDALKRATRAVDRVNPPTLQRGANGECRCTNSSNERAQDANLAFDRHHRRRCIGPPWLLWSGTAEVAARPIWEGLAKYGGVETPTTRDKPAKTETARLIQVLTRRRAEVERSPFSASRETLLQAIDHTILVLQRGHVSTS
jgi:hypothetical protein